MNTIPLVTICCITYNQARFIKDAIEGFLMQKTSFPFEIIIHDDASTDGTTQIIMDYAKKYPDLIYPIIQTENQYSKKQGRIAPQFVWPRARGKYLALCEGDDYWTDPDKLQKQVNGLNEHPECYICFHSALRIDELNASKIQKAADYGITSKVFSPGEVIAGEGGFMPTATIIINRKLIKDLPDWYSNASVGDYYLQIIGSLNGGALYLNDTMAVYRANVEGSWTDSLRNADVKLAFYKKQLETLDWADEYTKFYNKEFKSVKRNLLRGILKDRLIKVEYRKQIYLQNTHIVPFRNKLLWKIVYQHPGIFKTLSGIKKIVKR